MKTIFGYCDRVRGQTTDRVVREDSSEEKTFVGNLNDVKDSVMRRSGTFILEITDYK